MALENWALKLNNLSRQVQKYQVYMKVLDPSKPAKPANSNRSPSRSPNRMTMISPTMSLMDVEIYTSSLEQSISESFHGFSFD